MRSEICNLSLQKSCREMTFTKKDNMTCRSEKQKLLRWKKKFYVVYFTNARNPIHLEK